MRVHSSGQPLVWMSVLLIALAISGCGEDGGTAPDTNPPEISAGPTIISITEGGARVVWTTTEPATSEVSYGTTPTYGSSQQSTTLSNEHSVLLTNLTAYTLYHFRVSSTDASGNVATSGDGQFTTDRSLEIYLSEGWQHLANDDVASARTSFTGALGKSSTNAEAHLGVAWCDYHERMYTDASESFETALTYLTSQQLSLDAQVGLAMVSATQADLDQALVYAQSVLAQDPEYTFSYLPQYDYMDLHVILARAYYAAGNYEAAQAEVDYLNPHHGLYVGMPGYTVMLQAAINALWLVYCEEGQGGTRCPETRIEG